MIMDAGETPRPNRRRTRRKSTRPSARVECRVGAMGLGPDIALALHDASEEGLLLIVKVPLPVKQEVEILLTPPGLSRPLKRFADVIWSAPRDAGGYWAGCKLRKRLRYADYQNLT
jgi:hypothetical protein